MNTTQDFLHPTSATFDRDVLASDAPVLVEFWAPWCGPCVAFKPVVETVARARGLKTAFVNVDEQPELAARHGIQSIPAIQLYRAGRQVAQAVGARSRTDLERWLEENQA